MAGILLSRESMTTPKLLLRILFAGALLSACASGPRARPESAQRVPDSAPDKIAAQRAAGGLHQEDEDARWGFTAARELRQRKEQRKAQPPLPPAGSGARRSPATGRSWHALSPSTSQAHEHPESGRYRRRGHLRAAYRTRIGQVDHTGRRLGPPRRPSAAAASAGCAYLRAGFARSNWSRRRPRLACDLNSSNMRGILKIADRPRRADPR